jgi:hypothetical protein
MVWFSKCAIPTTCVMHGLITLYTELSTPHVVNPQNAKLLSQYEYPNIANCFIHRALKADRYIYFYKDVLIEVRSPAGQRVFSLASVSRPSLLSSGYWEPFPGVKRCRGVTLTTHPRLMPRSMSRSYTSLPPPPQASPWRVLGEL